MIYENDRLRVRRLSESDKHLLVKWLTDPVILEFFEGRDNPHDIEKVNRHYYPEDDGTTRCIVEYDGLPIGYIQFYLLDMDAKTAYGYESDEAVYGMDQFIGESAYWNRGIGKQLVRSMARYLLKERGAARIVMDPQAWNERAIRCYQRSGFRKVGLLPKHEWHEKEARDCWLMEYSDRP